MSLGPRMTQDQWDVLKKLVSTELPNIVDLFRRDVLSIKLLSFLCENMGIVDDIVHDKNLTNSCGHDTIQFETDDSVEHKIF